MGYHVTIRRPSETGNDRSAITIDQLRTESVERDTWELDLSDATPSYNLRGSVQLTCWLTDGELWTVNPTDDAMRAMLQLAKNLDARVVGDALETYRDDLSTYTHRIDLEALEQANQQSKVMRRKTRRHQWLVNITIITFFVMVSIAISRCGSGN